MRARLLYRLNLTIFALNILYRFPFSTVGPKKKVGRILNIPKNNQWKHESDLEWGWGSTFNLQRQIKTRQQKYKQWMIEEGKKLIKRQDLCSTCLRKYASFCPILKHVLMINFFCMFGTTKLNFFYYITTQFYLLTFAWVFLRNMKNWQMLNPLKFSKSVRNQKKF